MIAVLAVGFAFADVTKFEGSAQVDYVVGLDEGAEFGFKNSTKTTFKFTFEFASDGVDKAEHTTDVWAEIAAEARVGYKDVQAAADGKGITYEGKVTKANIHIKDLTINILGPHAAYNYASSFRVDANKDPVFDWANNDKFDYKVGGVELLYAGYSLSIAQYKSNAAAAKAKAASLGDPEVYTAAAWAAKTGKDKYSVLATSAEGDVIVAKKVDATPAKAAGETLTLFIGAETKKFEFNEEMSFQAAANGLLVGTRNVGDDEYSFSKKAGVAAKFNYKAEKVNAGAAIDVDYSAKTLSLEALVTGGYDFVSGGVYFGFIKAEDEDPEKVLEAYVKAAIPAGDYTINVYAEADRLLLNEKPEDADWHFDEEWAGFTVKADTTIDKLTVGVYGNWNQTIDAIGDALLVAGMNFGADLTYKAEKFTAKAGAAVNFTDLPDDEFNPVITAYGLLPYASISTTSIVENCTLSLGWSDARIIFNEDYEELFEKSNGKITATAKIAF